jgi:hypothetical protein
MRPLNYLNEQHPPMDFKKLSIEFRFDEVSSAIKPAASAAGGRAAVGYHETLRTDP